MQWWYISFHSDPNIWYKVYQGLQCQPQIVQSFLVYVADRNERRIRQYKIKLVEWKCKESSYVAPIEDGMLLALDFMWI